jgi:hypothetical protein
MFAGTGAPASLNRSCAAIASGRHQQPAISGSRVGRALYVLDGPEKPWNPAISRRPDSNQGPFIMRGTIGDARQLAGTFSLETKRFQRSSSGTPVPTRARADVPVLYPGPSPAGDQRSASVRRASLRQPATWSRAAASSEGLSCVRAIRSRRASGVPPCSPFAAATASSSTIRRNHLDTPAMEQLESALAAHDGTVRLVTRASRFLAAFGATATLEP